MASNVSYVLDWEVKLRNFKVFFEKSACIYIGETQDFYLNRPDHKTHTLDFFILTAVLGP